ncbi:MAG: ADP-ribosylglycohydrolase family protein [Pseudomonadota bacterium]
MIGAIIGDIVGSVYEEANIKTKDFPLFQRASRFTDDTVLTLALADAYLHERDVAACFRRFCAWYPRAGYGALFKSWAADPAAPPYNSFGNGAAMRVSAAAYVARSREAVLQLARDSAAVTHNHSEGIKGAEAIALATFLARSGASKAEVMTSVADYTGYDLGFSLADIRDGYFFDATCQGSVPQALVAFREGEDFEDVLRGAISIGGDSDTIACMAGSVAGAFYPIPAAIDREARGRLDERLTGVLALFEGRFGT